MSKQRTALQQAIEQIELQAEDYQKRGDAENSFMLIYKSEALFDSINLLQSLLPVEREAIEAAYLTGILGDANSPLLKDDDRKAAQDYFNSKYESI